MEKQRGSPGVSSNAEERASLFFICQLILSSPAATFLLSQSIILPAAGMQTELPPLSSMKTVITYSGSFWG